MSFEQSEDISIMSMNHPFSESNRMSPAMREQSTES